MVDVTYDPESGGHLVTDGDEKLALVFCADLVAFMETDEFVEAFESFKDQLQEELSEIEEEDEGEDEDLEDD